VSPEAEPTGSSFYLVKGNRYVAFTKTEEAADRQDYLVRLARLGQKDVLYLTNFLIALIVYV
jgi:hypothetical protein